MNKYEEIIELVKVFADRHTNDLQQYRIYIQRLSEVIGYYTSEIKHIKEYTWEGIPLPSNETDAQITNRKENFIYRCNNIIYNLSNLEIVELQELLKTLGFMKGM